MTNDRPAAPPNVRVDAPLYLARFRERTAARQSNGDDPATENDEAAIPLYLRQFRDLQETAEPRPTANPLWERSSLEIQQALTEDNRNKEISAPQGAARQLVNDVYLIRHGETQGYSTDSGLTPPRRMAGPQLRPDARAASENGRNGRLSTCGYQSGSRDS